MRRSFGLIIIFALVASPAAAQQWQLSPDNRTATISDDVVTFGFKCNDKDEFALVFQINDSDLEPVIKSAMEADPFVHLRLAPANRTFANGSDALTNTWYFGQVGDVWEIRGQEGFITYLHAHEIMEAPNTFEIALRQNDGSDAAGNYHTAQFTARGATAAIRPLIEPCRASLAASTPKSF